MFRKNNPVQEEVEINTPEIQDMQQLEDWVVNLIDKLELNPGQFMVLPAYGGVLLYILHQGITWVPYSEIRLVEGKVDKKQIMESGVILSGLAVVYTGGLALPFLLIPSFLKGWYRSLARPSPKKTLTFLQSMIDEVVVTKTDIKTNLLEKFEDRSLKPTEGNKDYTFTYTFQIKRKYFNDNENKNTVIRFFKYLTSVFTGKEVAIFPIHPLADAQKFIDVLKDNKLSVTIIDKDFEDQEMPSDGIVI